MMAGILLLIGLCLMAAEPAPATGIEVFALVKLIGAGCWIGAGWMLYNQRRG
jgi:hypothetical protein